MIIFGIIIKKRGYLIMIKKDTQKLKSEFNMLIDKKPTKKDQELCEDLKKFNASFINVNK